MSSKIYFEKVAKDWDQMRSDFFRLNVLEKTVPLIRKFVAVKHRLAFF